MRRALLPGVVSETGIALARRTLELEELRAVPGTTGRRDGEKTPDAPLPIAALTVAAYVSIGYEPSTHELLDRLHAAGVRVLLPVLLPDNDLDWAAYEGAAHLLPAARGLLEPDGPRLGPEAVTGADVVLLPGLAVDGRGLRLGRGGGSYDRVLARLERAGARSGAGGAAVRRGGAGVGAGRAARPARARRGDPVGGAPLRGRRAWGPEAGLSGLSSPERRGAGSGPPHGVLYGGGAAPLR